jgi:hypothetical protein
MCPLSMLNYHTAMAASCSYYMFLCQKLRTNRGSDLSPDTCMLSFLAYLSQQHSVAYISPKTSNTAFNYVGTQLTQGGTVAGSRPLWNSQITGAGEVRMQSCIDIHMCYIYTSIIFYLRCIWSWLAHEMVSSEAVAVNRSQFDKADEHICTSRANKSPVLA